jgi:hypothetical protein
VNTEQPADFTELSGAYALDALTEAEGAAFEAHLEVATQSRYEVDGLVDTALLLGLATAPLPPSPELKQRLLAAIAVTPQLPRLADAGVVSDAEAGVPAPRVPGATERAARSGWGVRSFRPLLAVASLAAVVGLSVSIGVLANLMASNDQQNVQASRLAAISASADVQRAVADVAGGGTATLVWSNELLSSALIVDGIAVLPESRVYELWYLGESGPRAAGTFTVDSGGGYWFVLTGDMHSGDAVGVTIEPFGGSELPTTDPVVAIASS